MQVACRAELGRHGGQQAQQVATPQHLGLRPMHRSGGRAVRSSAQRGAGGAQACTVMCATTTDVPRGARAVPHPVALAIRSGWTAGVDRLLGLLVNQPET